MSEDIDKLGKRERQANRRINNQTIGQIDKSQTNKHTKKSAI